MRDVPWDRVAVINRVKRDIWRYVSPAARREAAGLLVAGALLRLSVDDLRHLARIHFVLSSEVAELLDQMPRLARRLATTSLLEEERSSERIRGPIQWGPTIAEQHSTGDRNRYVTAPAMRAFQTRENELLAHVLEGIADTGDQVGWTTVGKGEVGNEVANRVKEARRWAALRALSTIERRAPTPRSVRTIQGGRKWRAYGPAVDVYRRSQELLATLDPHAIRAIVEDQAIVTSEDPILLELHCTFEIIHALEAQGWSFGSFGLLGRSAKLRATRDDETLEFFVQHVPPELGQGSRYRAVQRNHGFTTVSGLAPDGVLRIERGGSIRWIIVEVKGLDRPAVSAARAAMKDLLMYRRDLDDVLSTSSEPYGLGIAWGAELEPKPGEIVLCTPDRIGKALRVITDR